MPPKKSGRGTASGRGDDRATGRGGRGNKGGRGNDTPKNKAAVKQPNSPRKDTNQKNTKSPVKGKTLKKNPKETNDNNDKKKAAADTSHPDAFGNTIPRYVTGKHYVMRQENGMAFSLHSEKEYTEFVKDLHSSIVGIEIYSTKNKAETKANSTNLAVSDKSKTTSPKAGPAAVSPGTALSDNDREALERMKKTRERVTKADSIAVQDFHKPYLKNVAWVVRIRDKDFNEHWMHKPEAVAPSLIAYHDIRASADHAVQQCMMNMSFGKLRKPTGGPDEVLQTSPNPNKKSSKTWDVYGLWTFTYLANQSEENRKLIGQKLVTQLQQVMMSPLYLELLKDSLNEMSLGSFWDVINEPKRGLPYPDAMGKARKMVLKPGKDIRNVFVGDDADLIVRAMHTGKKPDKERMEEDYEQTVVESTTNNTSSRRKNATRKKKDVEPKNLNDDFIVNDGSENENDNDSDYDDTLNNDNGDDGSEDDEDNNGDNDETNEIDNEVGSDLENENENDIDETAGEVDEEIVDGNDDDEETENEDEKDNDKLNGNQGDSDDDDQDKSNKDGEGGNDSGNGNNRDDNGDNGTGNGSSDSHNSNSNSTGSSKTKDTNTGDKGTSGNNDDTSANDVAGNTNGSDNDQSKKNSAKDQSPNELAVNTRRNTENTSERDSEKRTTSFVGRKKHQPGRKISDCHSDNSKYDNTTATKRNLRPRKNRKVIVETPTSDEDNNDDIEEFSTSSGEYVEDPSYGGISLAQVY